MTTLALPSFPLRAFVMALLLLPALGAAGQTCSIQAGPGNCPGEPVSFQANVTTGPGFVPVSYQWSFGDGASGSGPNVSHAYPFNAAPQIYTVQLTVIDTLGPNDTCTATLTLPMGAAPPLTLQSGTFFDNTFCTNSFPCGTTFMTTIVVNSPSPGPFVWNWGDGTTTTGGTTQTHTYTGFGTYPLTITAQGASCPSFSDFVQFYTLPNDPEIDTPSPQYCENEQIDVLINPAVVQCPGNISYYVVYWDYANDPTNRDTIFNTATSSVSIAYDFPYNFVCSNPVFNFATFFTRAIRLVPINPCMQLYPNANDVSYDENPVKISIAPEPEFSFPSPLCWPGGASVSFTNQSCPSSNPVQPLTYLWDFGDPASGASNTSTLEDPTHVFSAPGVYTITLTATNDSCGGRSWSEVLRIGLPPAASLANPDTARGCGPLTVAYQNTTPDAFVPTGFTWAVLNPNGSPAPPSSYQFTAGSSGSASPTITFTGPDTLRIRMIAQNICGRDTLFRTVIVDSRPALSLLPLPDSCGTVSYLPSLASLLGNGQSVDSIRWNFGPGALPATFLGLAPGAVSFVPPPGGGGRAIQVTAYNACGSTTAVDSFILSNSLALSAGTPDTLCLGDTICLTPNFAGGTFTPPGIPGSPGCYSPGLPGSYTIIYTLDTLNCLFRDTVALGVNDLPTPLLAAAGNDSSLCVGDTLLFSVNLPGGTLSLNGSASGLTLPVNANTFLYVPANAGNATITYTLTDNAGCQGSDLLGVIVHPLPVVNIVQPSLSLCVSNTPQSLPALLNESPAGGTWSVPGGSFTPSVAGTFTVYYSFTNANGCSGRDSVQIIVSEPTPTDAGPGDTVCVNAPAFQLTGATPAGGSWSGPGVSLGGFFNPAAAGAGAQVLTYSTGTGTCLRQDTRTITVLPVPVVDAGPNASLCAGDTLALQGLPAGGTWSGSAAIAVVNGNVFFLPTTPAPGGASQNVTLTYTYTNPATGCTQSDTRVITVHARPVVNIVQPSLSLCVSNTPQSLPALLSVSPAGGTWSVLGGSFTPSVAGTFTVYYSFTNANGCSGRDSVQIIVSEPTPTDAGPGDTVCVNAPAFQLTGATPAGGSWSGPGVSLGGFFNPAAAGAGAQVLTYSTGTGTCLRQDTRTITVLPLPVVDAGPNASLCAGTALPLAPLVGGSTGGSGVWTATPVIYNAFIINGNSFVPPANTAAASVTLTYTYTDTGNGISCVVSDSRVITLCPLPAVDVAEDTLFLCFSPQLQSLPALVNESPVGGTWAGPGIVNAATGSFNPSLAGLGDHLITYTSPPTSCGCINSSSFIIRVQSPVPAFAGPNDTLCRNDGPLVLAGAPGGGQWESLSGTTVSANNILIFNPLTAGASVSFVYVIFEGSSCEQRDTVRISVNDTTTLFMGPLQRACVDAPLQTLTGYSPAGGAWSHPLPGLVTPGGQVNPGLLAPNSNVLLSYSFTNVAGCMSEAVKAFRSDSLPLVNIFPTDTTYCQTNVLQPLPSRTPAGGTWSGPGVVGGQYLPAAAGSFTLVYAYVNSLGCDASDSLTVTVVPPVPALAGPDTALCANGSLYSRTGLPAGGYWRQIGSAFFTAGNLLIFNPQAFVPGGYAFEYIIFEETSCEQRDTALLTVLAPPALSTLPDSACLTSLPLLLSQGYVGGVQTAGSWFGPGVQAQGGAFAYAGPPGSPLPYTETLFYTYTLAYPAFNTGCSDTAAGSVTVMPQPTLSLNPLPDNCVNTPVAFSSSLTGPFPATSYLWSFGDGGTSNLPAPFHAYADTGSFAVTLVAFTDFGCADTLGSSVFISEPPQPQFAASVDTGCAIRNILPPLPVFAGVPDAAGLAVSFADQSLPAGGSYFWDFGGGYDANGNGTSSLATPPLIYFAQDSNAVAYVVSLIIANYCDTVVYQDTIVVNPLPQVLFGPSGASSGCSIFPVNFVSLTQGNPTSFAWYAEGQLFSTQPVPPTQFYSYNGTGDTTYLIRLIATNACGSDTGFHEITVFPNTVDPSFNVSLSQACPGQEIRLINLSAAPNSGNFSMGDGTSYANSDTVFHSYSAPGIYQIAHYVDNGCSYDTAYFTVNIFANTALIQPSDSVVCPGEPVSFQVLPPGAVSGPVWDFGDGTGDSSSLSPVHIYYQPGSYTISLGGTTTVNGCPVAASAQVQVAPAPSASIQASVQAGCLGANGLTVSFSATPQLPGALYLWSFGDGNFGSGASLSHTYADTGFHEVLLLVSAPAQFACPGADTLRIYVRPNPEAAFSFSLSDSCGGPSTALFLNLSTDTLVSYLWNFGTGAPSTASNPQFVYPSFGVYPISLTVTDLYNCQAVALDTAVVYEQPVAAFQATPGQGCEPLDVLLTPQATGFSNLIWDLGNGQASVATQPFVQSYASPNQPVTQYLVTLVAANAGICFDTAQVLVEVSSLPLSDFRASADTVCGAPATIAFQQQASDLGAILSYAWNFGDPASGAQNTSAQANPSHLYAAPGLYSVTLVVTNDRGCRDTAVRQVLILAQPRASISADRTTGCFDRPFLLENIQPDNATGRRWELCDGRVFNGASVAIPFTLPDTCRIVLIADNSGFCFARDSITLRVGTPPVSDFAMQVLGECADTVEVYLQNNSLFANQYRWDFGDGRFSTEFEPLIYYTFPDDYLVTLIARNDFGCEDTSSQIVEYLRSIADFDFGPRRGCEDLEVQFSDASTQVTEWTWDFGDGSPLSFDSMPSHTYTRAGQFYVTLYVSYQGLCRDTFRHPVPVEVLESPVAAFEALKTGRPGEFAFRDLSPVPSDTLFWDFGDGAGSSAERNPTYQYTRYDTVVVTMIARNLNGCADTARDTLQNGAYGLWIPNVLHPGAGGQADLFTQFKPVGIGLAEFEIAVYNKYGNVVWASSALDGEGAPAEAWDGRINGSLTTMEVFGWKVLKARFRDGSEWNGPREGSVTVLR